MRTRSSPASSAGSICRSPDVRRRLEQLAAPPEAGRRPPHRAERAGRSVSAARRRSAAASRCSKSSGSPTTSLYIVAICRSAAEFAARFARPAVRARSPRRSRRSAAARCATWERDLRTLAAHPNVWCKLSGLVTEADWAAWTPATAPAVSRRRVRLLRRRPSDGRIRLAGVHGGRRLRAHDGAWSPTTCRSARRANATPCSAATRSDSGIWTCRRRMRDATADRETRGSAKTTRLLASSACSRSALRAVSRCSRSRACVQRRDTSGKPTIAVIPKGTSHVFWQSIHAGAEKAAQRARRDDHLARTAARGRSRLAGVGSRGLRQPRRLRHRARAARRSGARAAGRRRARSAASRSSSSTRG